MTELEILKKALEQERLARLEAEQLAARTEAELQRSRLELQQLNQQLAEKSEEHSQQSDILARFPEEMPDPIMRISRQGIVVYSNKAYTTHWAPYFKLQQGDPYPPLFQQEIEKARQEHIPHVAEFTIGARSWSVQFSAVSHHNYINLLGRDITEQKQAAEELRKSREALLEAQELGNLGRWELNIKEISLHWSPQLYRQYGLNPETNPPAGGDFFSYLHPDDVQIAREGIELAIREGFAQYEQRIIRPDGSIRHLYTTVKAEYSDSGEAIRIYGTSLDITELRHTEEQLHKSEERFNLAMQGMNDGIWDWNLKTNEVYLSPQWKALLGYEDHQLENNYDTFCCFAHPEDSEEIKKLVEASLTHRNQNLSYQCRIQHRDGSWLHMQIRSRMIYSKEGELTRMVGANTDITQQIKDEQKLIKTIDQLKILSRISFSFNSVSEDFEKPIQEAIALIGTHTGASRVYIFENSSDGVFASNTFEWCNQDIDTQIEELQNVPYSTLNHFRRLLKKEGLLYTNANALPQSIRAGLLKQSAKSLLIMPLYLQDTLAGFVGLDDCTKNRQWESTEIDLLQTFSNLLGNIFERQQAEDKVLHSEEKYRSLVDNLTQVIFQTDKNHCLTFLNPAWQEITGFSQEDCLNQPLSSYILPEDRAEFLSLQQLLNEHKIDFCRQVLRIRIMDGGIRYVEIFARLIENKWGQTEGLSGTLADVTEQQLTRDKLIKAKEGAEKASQAKAQFLSVMSHEIRTPLNAMLGISQLLIRQNPRHDQEENLKLLIFSGENLLSLINDILDFNKIESGKILLEKTAFNLRKLCHGLHKSLSLKADEKNIDFQLEIDTKIPGLVMGDPTRLTQILNNLLDNAIKFTHRGSVTLVVEMLGSDSTGMELSFTVKDTGIGIPKESMGLIFESFTQAHQSSSKKYGGTGLGLAIIKRLLELQGSQVEVDSTEGLGSEFRFALFFGLASETELPEAHSSTSQLAKKRLQHASLLLVEDNPLNMLVLVQFFENWGVQPDVAENGLQALEKLKKKHYDLVLMDLHMPELDGVATTQRIRNELHLENLPVIALTANAMPGIRLKVLNAGMNDYISKPFEPEDLYRKVLKYLPQQQETAPATADQTEPLETVVIGRPLKDARFSLKKLYQQSNNNEAFVLRMASLFINTCQAQQASLRASLLQGDAATVREIAHKLKPSIDLFDIRCQQKSIRRLELMELTEMQTPEGWSMAEELICCLQEVCQQMEQWLAEQTPETAKN